MEIERKYLVANDGWKADILSSARIVQFYLTGLDQSPTVRLRLVDDHGILTLKYPSVSDTVLARDEFEYEIPKSDVEAQLHRATGAIIRKTRHNVKGPDGQLWEVDEFAAPVGGLILAEIELKSIAQSFARPDWLGKDVTQDPAYSNLSLSFSAQPTAGD